jgi:K+-sensing histidine kinase KdpD
MKIYRRPRRSAITASRRPSAQRRAQQLRLLQEVSHEIAAALDVQEVLDRLVHSICSTKGTTFRVLLPLDEGAAAAEVVAPPPAAVSACRVLVVDDELIGARAV